MRNNGERIFSAVHIRNQYFIRTGGYVYALHKIHNTSMSKKQLCGSEAILSDSKVETKDNTISFYKYCKF